MHTSDIVTHRSVNFKTMAASFLLNDYVWPHSTGEDTRRSLFTFEVGEHTYGFFFFSIPHWMELLSFVMLESLLAALTAVVVYYSIVVPRKGRQKGPPLITSSLLTAFGILLPIWIFGPRYLVEKLGFHNKIFRFTLAVISPTLSIFRIMEALFGFNQNHEMQSLYNFVVFFSSPMLLVSESDDDNKTRKYVRAPTSRVALHLLSFLGYNTFLGLYLTIFYAFANHFPSLGDPSRRSESYYSWQQLFSLQQWKDTLLYAILFQICLYTFGEGLMFATSLVTGIQTHRFMLNPIFESKSPSDFWGRRWNLLIHQSLKQGVFKPVRSLGGSSATAVAFAFFASGLFHEWLLPTVHVDYEHLTIGPTMVFFLWQAVLVAGEAAIGHWPIFVRMGKKLPNWLRTCLVILLGLPFGHFFVDSYVHSAFFLHLKSFVPCILQIHGDTWAPRTKQP